MKLTHALFATFILAAPTATAGRMITRTINNARDFEDMI